MKVLLITTCVVLLQQDLGGNLYLHVNIFDKGKMLKLLTAMSSWKNEEKNKVNPKKVEGENNFTEYGDVSGQQVLGVITWTQWEVSGVCRCGLSRPRHWSWDRTRYPGICRPPRGKEGTFLSFYTGRTLYSKIRWILHAIQCPTVGGWIFCPKNVCWSPNPKHCSMCHIWKQCLYRGNQITMSSSGWTLIQ